MSDTATAQFVGDSIEEMLVSLAEGVREAQQALSAVPAVDAYGRPQPTYHLPYLDFDLQVKVVMQSSPGGRPIARLMPLTAKMAQPSSGSQSTEVSGNIQGRLVAVPPQQGLPLPVLRLSLPARQAPKQQTLLLEAANTAGERLTQQAVELNIDPAASQRLNPGLAWPTQLSKTRLQQAVVQTDGQGLAQAVLEMGDELPAGALLMVVASIGPVRAQGVVTV